MTVKQIADRLVTLCKERKFSTARHELYAENATSIEADNKPVSGLVAMDDKERNWHSSIEVIHDIQFSEPLINGRFFSVAITWNLTYKGKERGGWKEIAVFEVKDHRVILEKFYY